MTIFSENGAPGPRKPPVTYSKRPGLADRMRAASTLSDDGDAEARGAQAFDRVSSRNRNAQDYGPLARRATNVINGSRNKNPSKPLRRPGSLVKPSVRPADVMRRTEPSRSIAGLTSNTQEEDDIAEAMARSLDGALSSPLAPETEEKHDLDLFKAKLKSILKSNSPPKLPSKSRSYKNIGSSSTSTSASPHDALDGVSQDMDVTAKVLDERHNGSARLTGKELANYMKDWQGTIGKVLYASQAAEHQRIEDVQAQLDFDRDVEAAHAEEINGLNRAWAATMKKKERVWQRKMEELKGMYEAKLVSEKAKESAVKMEEEQCNHQRGHSEPLPSLRNATSPGKRRLDEEALMSEGADWSSKRPKTGRTL